MSTLAPLTLAIVLLRGASLALAAVINGDEGDDSLTGSDKRDVVRGFAGDDELRGRERPDALYGNSDGKLVYGGAGNDEVYAERCKRPSENFPSAPSG